MSCGAERNDTRLYDLAGLAHARRRQYSQVVMLKWNETMMTAMLSVLKCKQAMRSCRQISCEACPFDARSHHVEPTLAGPAALLAVMMLLMTFLVVALCLDVLMQVVRLLTLWLMLR